MKQYSLIFLSLLLLVVGCSKKTIKEAIEEEMNSINEQVLIDELRKFRTVLKTKDRTAICVQTGMVCAALLQAGKESEYLEWKKIEKELCDY
tara:strand:- start:150 stop:425 length:276 start_codon:yes stop_codon:yes gene_type:complete